MIFVSAGHHATKPGHSFQGYSEHDEAVVWATLLATNLGDYGILVPPGVIRDKVEFINNRDPVMSFAIEFHLGADEEAAGFRTFFSPTSIESLNFANAVHKSMSLSLKNDMGIAPGWYRGNEKNGEEFFLQKTDCPAIIVEPGSIYQLKNLKKVREVVCRDIASTLANLV